MNKTCNQPSWNEAEETTKIFDHYIKDMVEPSFTSSSPPQLCQRETPKANNVEMNPNIEIISIGLNDFYTHNHNVQDEEPIYINELGSN